MWLERATLAFLIVAVAAMGVIGPDFVMLCDKESSPVKVPFGSPINLKCNLMKPGVGRIRFLWLFNPSGPSINDAQNIFDKNRLNHADWKNESTLFVTSKAVDNNNGWYFCSLKEEIPRIKIINSTGTRITIMKSMELTSQPMLVTRIQVSSKHKPLLLDWWLWLLLGLLTLVLIVLLIAFLVLRRRWHRRRVEQPIYGNMRSVAKRQPSPRPGMPMNDLKTVSSCQHVRKQKPNRELNEGKQSHGK